MQLAFKGYHRDDFGCNYNAEAAVNFIPPTLAYVLRN